MSTPYSYDRRSAASATPSFDAVAKADLEPKLKQFQDRASKLVDKAEDLAEKMKAKQWVGVDDLRADFQKVAAGVAQEAYKVLDKLRPVLSGGRRELEDLKDSQLDAARQARALVDELHALDALRGRVLEETREAVPSEFVPVLHKLAMGCHWVRMFYKQFREAYWERR